ncbi:hypothetical protein HYH02_007148 [Chlamydomonas schloesseri]|uniref:Cyclic nucleotide-binding domain-containing protein n=1 Tax=Chlamydomonas schloesseri TaxID=2026947 RepID=A0A835WHL4_9CHLO|nr:hypothetical protein HYH02_007148 [Chlamydomonas schloesseri]|eukprot:KAG2447688.1 hypothetical protein HYH02_007148 [Chlamydomonas schloesseri]
MAAFAAAGTPEDLADVTEGTAGPSAKNFARWNRALNKNVTLKATSAFMGAADQRHAARKSYLAMAPESRSESALEVIDEVLVQSVALGRLTRNARLAAAKRAHVTEFQPGEELCSMGEVQDCVLVVMSGSVEVTEGVHSNRPTPIPAQPSTKRFSHARSSSGETGGRGAGSTSTSAESSIAGEARPSGPHHPRGSHLAATKPTALVSPLSAVDFDPLPRSLDPGGRQQPAHPALAAIQRSMAAGASASGQQPQPQPHSSSAWGSASARGELGAQRSQFGAGGDGSGGGSTVLHRGDTLGAIDLQWLSKQTHTRSSAAAAVGQAVSGSHLTSRAVLATRAEQQQQQQQRPGFPDVEEGSPATKAQNALQNQLRRLSALGDGGNASGAQSDGGDSDDGGDESLGLRWSCTAVAVARTECVAIGIRQLCEVLASEAWDVEALVDSLEELPMFAPLSTYELRQLARLLRVQVLPGGSVVYKQGTVGNDLFIIRSGYVRLLKQVTLDDNVRQRLNRMSAELSAVREQTDVAAAFLQNASIGPGGAWAGVPLPSSRTGTPRTGGRQGTPLTGTGRSTGGYEPPPSPWRTSRGANELAGTQHTSGAFTHRDRPATSGQVQLSPHRIVRPPLGPSGGMTARGHPTSLSYSGGLPQPVWGSNPAAAAAGQRRHSITALNTSPPHASPRYHYYTPLLPNATGRKGHQHVSTHHGQGGRRRSSSACADEVLEALGVTPRALGEHANAEPPQEELVNPEALYRSHADSSEEDGNTNSRRRPGASRGGAALPPVVPRLQLNGVHHHGPAHEERGQVPLHPPHQRPGHHQHGSPQGGAAAGHVQPEASGTNATGVVPVWAAGRTGRPLGTGEDLVFVELGTLGTGQCFGEVRPDGIAVRTSSAVCDTRTELLAISRTELYNRLGGRVFEYLWNQVPTEGAPPSLDPALEAGACAQQLERSMQWTLYKKKLVAEVLAKKGEERYRKSGALVCR